MNSIRTGAFVVPLLLWAQSAHAHGIAGNRFFDGTLSFDDPAVADEAIVPLYSQLNHPTTLGSDVGENRINWAFARLLTPTIAFTAEVVGFIRIGRSATPLEPTRRTSALSMRRTATTSTKR